MTASLEGAKSPLSVLTAAIQEEQHEAQPQSQDANGNGQIVKSQGKAGQSLAADGKLVEEEEREEGTAKLSTWLNWMRAAGGWSFMGIQILTLAADRGFYVLCGPPPPPFVSFSNFN